MEKLTPKSFIKHLLNGSALGIVVALVPGALLGELFKVLTPYCEPLGMLTQMIGATNAMVGIAVGVAIGYMFKFTPIESISVGLATMAAGGAVRFADGIIQLKGTGDIFTMVFTAGIAAGLIVLLRGKVRGYAILVVPVVSLFVAGALGRLAFPYFIAFSQLLGAWIAHLLTLEQTLMAVLIAIAFACLIVSPVSSVGIATAIHLAGVGSGAANLGICACAFSLAVAGRRVNPLGTCAAHFVGSPKLSMPNIVAKPKLLLPIMLNAALAGVLASLFQIQGTEFSAGFGISGLIGPVNHLKLAGWGAGQLAVSLRGVGIVPVAGAFAVDWLFVNKLKWIAPEDYKIDVS